MTCRFPALLAFGNQGCSWEMPSTIIKKVRQYFVALYGHKGFESLDQLREHIFVTTKSDLRVLLPTEDLITTFYQFALYKRSTIRDPQLPLPADFDRKLPSDKLVSIMMEKVARPDLSRNINCKCISSKCVKRYSCTIESVPCFSGCLCLGELRKCGRMDTERSSSESDHDSESDE